MQQQWRELVVCAIPKDENGWFTRSGPDITGQIRRLRTDNEIQFTRAGYRKLAFYTERPLRPILGTGNPLTRAAPRSVPRGPGDQLPRRENSAYHEVLVEGERLPVIVGELLGGDEDDGDDGVSQHSRTIAGAAIITIWANGA